MRSMVLRCTLALTAAIGLASPLTVQAQGKPNILVMWGDDIGIANISAYSDGVMGYETPNIDRIGKEGIRFLHYYGEQSCTAGRAAFLTGQHGIRTGLTKVGFPGAPMGMSQLDPVDRRAAEEPRLRHGSVRQEPRRRPQRDRLPTVNGFDEFFGNLYHLNAEEEPELPDYPKDPAYRAKFGPRGVLKCKATDTRRSDRRSALRPDRQADHRGYRPAHQEADGDHRRRNLSRRHRLHEAAARRGQAVLLLVERHAHAPAHARARRASRPLQTRRQRVHRRHDRARRAPSARCSRRWTTWASPTTRSSSTPATTART